ncbi:xylulokinase [Bythopirellula polymerisocia]|uniref:Xylulose kinase n=1 Tax=Bythopirellula polymerisocia TaxID=2528003 RepID=A0A5C6CDD7_9BACT|nr:FGGY family carbohydrate kinase [Bythopirellula polymerisocia]TWU21386.1 Xylulose kinase [Bythopirellula polymerisocia]
MASPFVIGVDIGTQGTKAALYTPEGRCLAKAFERSQLRRPSPGVVEEDPEQQVSSVCHTIKQCIAEACVAKEEAAGIAIDGQMAGILGVGADGRCVTPYDSWLDTRCAPQIASMQLVAGDEVLRKTGCAPSYNHGPKILWWKENQKKVYRSIRAFVQPGGYAAMRLCGLDASEAFLDKSYLHFSGFADNRRAKWDNELCERFSVGQEKLSRIVDSHAIVGELTSSAARRCGLKSGVPIVAGCGDSTASFLACGATQPGICVDVAGTASVFATSTDRFRPDKKNRTLACSRAATPGLWHPIAYLNGGGMNLEWFADEILSQNNSSDSMSLDKLDKEASQIEPSEDLPIFVPHLGGRVCPSQPHLRGAWVGLTWKHSRKEMFLAMLEAVVLEYGIYQQIIQSLYPDFDFREIRITGGGEKSELWNRMKADLLGAPVVQIAGAQGAPQGAAMLAAWGVGLVEDLPSAGEQWVTIGKTYQPNHDRSHYFQQRRKRYEQLIQALDGWSTIHAN